MRPLAPPIEVIESRLFGPSGELLMRWVEGDPSIPQDLVRALESDPEAQERRRHIEELERMMDQQGLASEAMVSPVQVPPMPAHLQDLFERRIASRKAHFSPKPRPGQILRIDEIRGPLGPLGWDLPEPLAVLIDQPDPQEPARQVWSGWMVAPETDYAGYWDMVLEPEDEPFDPTLAGMVQLWNPVYVYLPSTSIVLAELRPERLAAVRALAVEFLAPGEESGLDGVRPGWVATRRTLHGHGVLTGTPLGGEDDPRDRYRELYFAAAKAVKEPARLAVAELAAQGSWIERVWETLRRAFEAAGLTLRPGATPAQFVVQTAELGPALFRAATRPSGDLLELGVEPMTAEECLRLKAVTLSSTPLEVILETEGETQRVRLDGGRAEGQWLLQPDRTYTLRLVDATGAELARVALRPSPLEQMLTPNVQLLFRLIGTANPVFFLSQLPGAGALLRLLGWMRQLKGLGREPQKRLLIHGDPLVLRSVLPAAAESIALEVRLPRHVFPVHEATTGEGFVIPLDVTPTDTWQVSDAFGAFGLNGDPTSALLGLLARVEETWERVLGRVLPARWLRAFSLRLACPVHIDLFEGESLQLPLLVAVLRALGSGMTGDGREVLPFGEGPVFASATVQADGAFGQVCNLAEKLAGFVRELGGGRPAILTDEQRESLELERPELLAQVCPYVANSLDELLQLPELYEPLQKHVQDAYHPSMNERVLTLIHGHAREIKFDEAERLSRWLLTKVESPYYTSRLSCELALFQFHRGESAWAAEAFRAAHAELMARPDLFGADDFGRLLSILVNLAVDARSPDLFRTLSAELDAGRLAAMTAPQRVAVFGARCQFHRFYGEHAEAITAGREALALVDLACASEAGRSRNYLVHALIASYREGNRDPGLLDEASAILEQASTVWAPVDNPSAYRSHLGFCRHLEAEIARLRNEPFEPGAPLWAGKPWGHPWLFTLLSCARNPRNSADLRKKCVERLLTESSAFVARSTAGSLFGLFDAVFRLYAAVHEGRPQEEARSKLQGWLEEMAQQGFPGWKDYLSAFVREETDVEAVERLCDAIRYF